ncbi:hypothetical protein NFJ02_13g15300 [Pycnococcus provasolii]
MASAAWLVLKVVFFVVSGLGLGLRPAYAYGGLLPSRDFITDRSSPARSSQQEEEACGGLTASSVAFAIISRRDERIAGRPRVGQHMSRWSAQTLRARKELVIRRVVKELLEVSSIPMSRRMALKSRAASVPVNASDEHEAQTMAALNTWGRRAPLKALMRKSTGSRDSDQMVALSALGALYPNASYYVAVHDDTYVFVRNLLCELGRLAGMDGMQPVFGGLVHCKGRDFMCARGSRVKQALGGWPNGGAGILMSRGLLFRELSDKSPGSRLLDCAQLYSDGDIGGSDVALACCIADQNRRRGSSRRVTLVHVPSLTSGVPGSFECQCGPDDPDDMRDDDEPTVPTRRSRSRRRGNAAGRTWVQPEEILTRNVERRCTLDLSAMVSSHATFHRVDARLMHTLEALQVGMFGVGARVPAKSVPQLDLGTLARHSAGISK